MPHTFFSPNQGSRCHVLSKRWIHLWRSLTTLYFNEDYFILGGEEDYARFAQSVNAVMLSRDDHQPIHKFRLNCFTGSDYLDILSVNAWLNAAVNRHVQTLDISLCCEQRTPPLISSVIFNCKTLVVLKLQLLHLEPLVSSLDVDLLLLKVMHLQNVVFSKLDCLAVLLSGCPVLEDFKARDLCFGTHATDKEFKTSPKLVRVDISNMHSFVLMEVVKNVEFLHFDEIGWKFMDKGPACIEPYLSPFHKLTTLELSDRYYNNDWYGAVELLKYCPKLQALVISQPHLNGCAFDEVEEVRDWQYPPSVPECILLHLKSCFLNDYRGTNCQFRFARYILENRRFLKRMTICSDSMVNQPRKHMNFKKLPSCTKQSVACKLILK